MADEEEAIHSEPWVPRQVKFRPVKRTTLRRRATPKRPGSARPAWDVIWTFDGQRFFRRFDRAAEAEDFLIALQRGVATQLLFDPVGRRFIDPDRHPEPTGEEPAPHRGPESRAGGPTVAEWTQHYPAAGTVPSTTPSTWLPSHSSGSRIAPAAATTTARSPKAGRPRKRCERSSAASATPSGSPWSPTPAAP